MRKAACRFTGSVCPSAVSPSAWCGLGLRVAVRSCFPSFVRSDSAWWYFLAWQCEVVRGGSTYLCEASGSAVMVLVVVVFHTTYFISIYTVTVWLLVSVSLPISWWQSSLLSWATRCIWQGVGCLILIGINRDCVKVEDQQRLNLRLTICDCEPDGCALTSTVYSHLHLDRTKGTRPCDARLLCGSYDESCITNIQTAF